MRTLTFGLRLLAAVASTLMTALPAHAWQIERHGTALGSDEARRAVMLQDGSVVVAGSVVNLSTGRDVSVVRLAGADGAQLWSTELRGTAPAGNDNAFALALDSAEDVFVAGVLENAGTDDDLSVVKLDGGTGAELWRVTIDASESNDDVARALAIDAADDVVVAGDLQGSSCTDIAVVKLDGAMGTELWRTLRNGQPGFGRCDTGHAVTLDAAGNVFVGGALAHGGFLGRIILDFAVLKLSGTTGAIDWIMEWNSLRDDTAVARVLAVTPAGDVVAAGTVLNVGTDGDLVVMKLEGASGDELWRAEVDGAATTEPGGDEPRALTLDPDGHVVVAGRLEGATSNDAVVLELDGATGGERWRREIDGGGSEDARDVALDSAGDVLIAGGFFSSPSGMLAAKLDGESGAQAWLRRVTGSGAGGVANALVLDPLDDVILAGQLGGLGQEEEFAVVKVSGETGGEVATTTTSTSTTSSTSTTTTLPVGCLAGPSEACQGAIGAGKARLLVRDHSTDTGDKLVWKLSRGATTSFAELGSPTVDTDYSLCLYDASGALLATLRAPAGGICRGRPCWKVRGDAKGYLYKDPDRASDGVRILGLTPGLDGRTKLTLKAAGDGLPNVSLPLALPVTAQLRGAHGKCWSATYGVAGRNDAEVFKAKSD